MANSINYEKNPLEIMEGSVVEVLPKDATKETIRIQFIGQQKVMNWKEYADEIRKLEKKKAKAKITKQLESLPSRALDERKTDVEEETPEDLSTDLDDDAADDEDLGDE